MIQLTDDIIKHLRIKYHKFWYNIEKELQLPRSMVDVLKTCVEHQSRKHYYSDIQELLNKGELT